MSTKNFYPQFAEIAYKRTSVEMPMVVLFARSLIGKYPIEVIRIAYCIFRNESGNGALGVNNNYAGIQADNAVWEGLDLSNVEGTCVKVDGAGDTRRFICFNSEGYKTCFDFTCYKVQQRKMFAEVTTPQNVSPETLRGVATNLYNLYQKKWVANPKEDTAEARDNFISLYRSSLKAIA